MNTFKLVPPSLSIMEFAPYEALFHTLFCIILYSSCLVAILFIFNMKTAKTMMGTILVAVVYVMSRVLSSHLIFGLELSKWSLYEKSLFAAYYNPQIHSLGFTYSYFFLILFLLYWIGEKILFRVNFMLGVEE